MAGVPWRLQTDTDYSHNLALINHNFDEVAQDLRDFGANLSTEITLDTGSLAASSLTSYAFYLLTPSSTAEYTPERVVRTQTNIQAVANSHPLLDVYIDNDDDEAYKWPIGSSVSSQSHLITLTPEATVPTDALARYFVQINNREAGAHTYYLHFQAAYFVQGATGVFR